MKSKFLQISLGIATVLFALGFVIRSVGSLNAAPEPVRHVVEGSTVGKYTFDHTWATSDTYESLLVWDTEFGKATLYLYKEGQWVRSKVEYPNVGQ